MLPDPLAGSVPLAELLERLPKGEVRPRPLSQDALLGLFKGEAVGRGVVLQPATFEDMCGTSLVRKPSLEVVYDAV